MVDIRSFLLYPAMEAGWCTQDIDSEKKNDDIYFIGWHGVLPFRINLKNLNNLSIEIFLTSIDISYEYFTTFSFHAK
jgi:hypothetical protein